jgi:hypothetical protein
MRNRYAAEVQAEGWTGSVNTILLDLGFGRLTCDILPSRIQRRCPPFVLALHPR